MPGSGAEPFALALLIKRIDLLLGHPEPLKKVAEGATPYRVRGK